MKLYFETIEFQRLQYKDCLPHNDIYSLKSNQNTNYENCRKWCSENSNCKGFTVWQDTCYFKNKNCKDDIRDDRETNLFLLPGNVNKLNSWSRKNILHSFTDVTLRIGTARKIFKTTKRQHYLYYKVRNVTCQVL